MGAGGSIVGRRTPTASKLSSTDTPSANLKEPSAFLASVQCTTVVPIIESMTTVPSPSMHLSMIFIVSFGLVSQKDSSPSPSTSMSGWWQPGGCSLRPRMMPSTLVNIASARESSGLRPICSTSRPRI